MEDVDRMRQLYQQTDSYRRVAGIMGISRNTVAKYLKRVQDYQEGTIPDIFPEEWKVSRLRPACTPEICTRIHNLLESNASKPKKQRLHARQIWQILVNEDRSLSYSTVRREVRSWKQKNQSREVYIAQETDDGERAECDWGDVILINGDKPTKCGLLTAVLNSSLYRYGRVYPDKSQANLFHALDDFFHDIGGVPKNIFFDNMTSVVTDHTKKVFNERFLRFATHYGFCTNACNPASPQEKGTVEQSVSTLRRSAFAQRNSFTSLEEANEHLKYVLSRINNSPVYRRDVVPSVGLDRERKELLPVPSLEFSPYDLKYRKINRYSTVTFERNTYSVPESCRSEILALKVYSDTVEILKGDTCIASHPRLFGRDECSLKIEHYIGTLRRKPGALKYSRVLKQVDPCLQQLFSEHYPDKPKEFIRILMLMKEFSQDAVVYAIRELYEQGIIPEYETIRMILSYKPCPMVEPFSYKWDIEVPEPDLMVYNRYAQGGSSSG